MVKHPSLTVVTKDYLMSELVGRDIYEKHCREVSITEGIKIQKKMAKEKKEKTKKRKARKLEKESKKLKGKEKNKI